MVIPSEVPSADEGPAASFGFRFSGYPEHFPLSNCATRTARLELLNHAIEIGIACSKFPCEPVPTSLGNSFAVREHLELTGLTRRNDRVNTQAFLDEGHETRDWTLLFSQVGQ